MNVKRFLMAMGQPLLLVGLFSLPVQVHALGFGAIVLESHLNQSLKATIPMLLNASDDINSIRVELANADEYQQLGLQWQRELSLLRISLHAKHSGQPMVQLSSAELIHAPMLSILLKAKKTGRGTYFKHYQVLLDAAETLALRSNQPAVVALRTKDDQRKGDQRKGDQPKADQQASIAVDDGGWARIWRYGPVQRGDSLSEIAYRLRIDKRFSNRQVMLSLYEHNRAAFGNGNINRLIKGVWLNVPSAEVVQANSDPIAMKKLDTLLGEVQSVEKIAADVEAIKRDPVNASVVKPVAANDKARKVDPEKRATALRYSGKISMQGLDDAKTVTALKQGFDQQFGSIHQRLMAGKLQMTKLDETVSSLNVSMQVVKQDIQSIKRDIEIIKMRTEGPSNASFMTWQLALIVALMAMIAVLLVIVFRKKKEAVSGLADRLDRSHDQHMNNADESHVAAQSADLQANESNISEPEASNTGASKAEASKANAVVTQPRPVQPEWHDQSNDIEFVPSSVQTQPFVAEDTPGLPELGVNQEAVPVAEEVVQLLNQLEESLGQCEFEKATAMLDQVEAKWPDSLRASALKAQLFYETDRHAEMHDLINGISATSDEQRWEQFCYFLPSHVWNACFGDAASPASPPRSDSA